MPPNSHPTPPPTPPRKRLGELLIEAGVIDSNQLQAALAHQRKWRVKLGQALVDLRLASEQHIVAALSRRFGYPTVDLAALRRTTALEEALKLVPADLAVRHTVLPVWCDATTISVVMSDPSNVAVIDELAFRTDRRVKVSIAGDHALQAMVQRLYVGESERGTAAAARSQPGGTVAPVAPTTPPTLAATTASAPTSVGATSPADPARAPVTEPPASGRDALAVALARLLVRKGVVTAEELAAELRGR